MASTQSPHGSKKMKIRTQFLVSCTGLLTTASLCFANPVDYYYDKQKRKANASHSTQAQELYFAQRIDHKNPQRGTFSQRYFLDESYALGNDATVLFYLCGQETCSQDVLYGSVRDLAQKYHAKLLAVEHRYYGQSMPVKDFEPDSMRLLNTQQVLADLVYFENEIKVQNSWTGPWIVVGGSYSGAIAAYYRLKFPNMVVGAIASSAPVMAKENFMEYDQLVTQAAGPACAQAINEVVREIDGASDNSAVMDRIKELFAASEVTNTTDFINLTADIAASAIMHGERDKFCSYLVANPNPLQGYALFARELFQNFQISPVSLTPQGALSENIDDFNQGFGLRQWYYQACREYGDWENAHPNPFLSTRSPRINSKYRYKTCKRLFDLQASANTGYINVAYYQPLLTPVTSNIYFINGENDPWSYLSITPRNGNATNNKLTYHLIQNGSRSDDMPPRSNTDSKSLKRARLIMDFSTQVWLLGCHE